MATTTDARADWMWLPYVVLTSVVSYLVNSRDYIRFSIVCKQWHAVAKDQKHRHMATAEKQVPFLLMPTDTPSDERLILYSVAERRLLDFQLKIPYPMRRDCCGFHREWLAFSTGGGIIKLFNLFTRTEISLPRIETEDGYNSYHVQKVVLSADPSFHPSHYTVAALIHSNSECRLALIRPGRDKKWTSHFISELEEDCLRFDSYDDIMLDKKGKWAYATEQNRGILVCVNVDTDDRLEVVCPKSRDIPFVISEYLVETTNGDVLVIEWRYGSRLRVLKLQAGSSFVEVGDLNGDAVFIGEDNRSVSAATAARDSCGIEADCIYFLNSDVHCMKKYNVRDKTMLRFRDVPKDGSLLSDDMFWISPSINL